MRRFLAWRRERPVVGGVLFVLSGVEFFLSSQLDLGHIKIQMGIEGLQSTIIPIAVIAVGVLAIAMPQHRVFYGVIGLAVAIYAIVGLNLGGFVLGTLLGAVGGVLTVAWMPRTATAPAGAADAAGDDAEADEAVPAADDEVAADAGSDPAEVLPARTAVRGAAS